VKDCTNVTTVSLGKYLFPYMMNGSESSSLLDRSPIRGSAFVLLRCLEAMPLEVVQVINALSGLSYFLDFTSFSRKYGLRSKNWNWICGTRVQLQKILPTSIIHGCQDCYSTFHHEIQVGC